MNIFNWLKWIFNKAVSVFRDFLAEALPIAKQILIAKLKDIATNAVTELANTDLNSEQKRKEAFGRIKDYAVKNSLDVKDSLINLTLELAVQRLKF